MTNTLRAYHNDPKIKKAVINEMAKHRKADNLLQGYGYWSDGKGCAVGCLIKGSNHKEYETQFGIPEMLAHLEDTIFEGLPKKGSVKWPERFLRAIKPGSDLSLVGYKFIYWNLTENLILKDSDSPEVQEVIIRCRKAIKQCAEAICPLTKGEPKNEKNLDAARSAASAAWSAAWNAARSAAARAAESAARSAARAAASAAESAAWSAARSAAWSAAVSAAERSAARAARSAAESAAWSAAASAAESAARSAARSAASAAESAAWSAARSAAWSAARAARSAAESAAWSAESAAVSAAESAAYIKMADKLIQLIEEAA